MPSFTKVLTAIAETWRTRRDEVAQQSARVVEAISRASSLEAREDPLSTSLPTTAARALRSVFDVTWGGFGGAPKFPPAMTLEFLLRRHVRGDPDALDMVTVTLDHLADGGIRDHVGGGFHRHSTDARWHVPHFEKMLYDNALLVRSFVHAWQVTGAERYARVARDTCDYLLREMRHTEGGFFSSQDADSEGVEGRFFVWSWEELVDVAGEGVATAFGATPSGNWEGTNVLWRPIPLAAVADEMDLDPAALERDLERSRGALFDRRERRVRPATDDKILAAWNGLAISALAEAGRALGEPRYVDAAADAARFVLEALRDDGGRLLRSWREGRPGRPGFADDHAAMADACLALYETTFELTWFERASELTDELIRAFHDDARGGFFQTRADGEALVVRPKELYDNALPSANSLPADVLLRLAHLTGESRYEEIAERSLRLVADGMTQAPTGFGHALCALDLLLEPVREIAIVGDPGEEPTRALAREVTARFLPNHVLAVARQDDERSRSAVALLEARTQLDGSPTAYVCERFACKLPVSDPEALARQLLEP
jgi:uncharacterized protein YyaL (SSP411 family)